MKKQIQIQAPKETVIDFSRRQFLRMTTAASTIIAARGRNVSGFGQNRPAGSTQQPIYLTDLDRCQPQSALSRKARSHYWRLLDYETDTCKGTMLVAGQNTLAPEITYPVTQK